MVNLHVEAFDRAAADFPLTRVRRSSPAYARIVMDPDSPEALAAVIEALKTDPNAADLHYHLARLYLRMGNQVEYRNAVQSLKKLLPHSTIEEVQLGASHDP